MADRRYRDGRSGRAYRPAGVAPASATEGSQGSGAGGQAAGSRRGSDRIGTVARNRRARHDYDILETFECGIALQGCEVKSLRAGRVTLADAYARVEGGEAWLLGVHIPPYEHAAGSGPTIPSGGASCLLHRDQIDELMGQTQQQSLTLVPLSIYFKDGRAKVELALARGRRLYDKRHAIATRDAEREAAREARGAAGQGRWAGAGEPRASAEAVRPARSADGRERCGQPTGGDRFRLWSSMWEKRAVVSGATLKSRNKKQTPSLSSRSQPRNCDVRPVSVLRAGTGRHLVGLT